MSKPDEFDAMAEWLLPCAYDYVPVPEGLEHWGNCPAYYRPAVASKLRERELQWRELLSDLHDEIAALRAQLAAANTNFNDANECLVQIYEDLDGLPISGEQTGPKSRKYLDAVEQIRALRAQLAAANTNFNDANECLVQIYEDLDGLPISGEQTGPKSRKYLDAVEQIRALRAQLAAATKDRK